MCSSNCCFLSCIQISQEADQVVWYSHFLKNFPQFVVIHTVKGFGVVNKTEVDVFSGILLLFWWASANLNSAFKWVYLSFSICLSLLFFSQPFVSPPQTTILTLFISFSWGCFYSLPPVQYCGPLSIALQAYCLLDLVPWIYLLPPLHIHRGFRLYLAGLVVVPAFFSLSLNFAMRSWWSEPQSTPGLVFADSVQLLHF